jgi:hypothetical protein
MHINVPLSSLSSSSASIMLEKENCCCLTAWRASINIVCESENYLLCHIRKVQVMLRMTNARNFNSKFFPSPRKFINKAVWKKYQTIMRISNLKNIIIWSAFAFYYVVITNESFTATCLCRSFTSLHSSIRGDIDKNFSSFIVVDASSFRNLKEPTVECLDDGRFYR